MIIAIYPSREVFVKGIEERRADLTVFGKPLPAVSYKRELAGQTHILSLCVEKSLETGGVALFFADTESYGVLRRSVIVADAGKVLGVSDELGVTKRGYAAGSSVRVYETSAGNLGVLAGGDLLRYEPAHALSLAGSDMICHLTSERRKELPVLAEALGYFLGVPILSVSPGIATLAGTEGELLAASPTDGETWDFSPEKKEQPLLLSVKRGRGEPVGGFQGGF